MLRSPKRKLREITLFDSRNAFPRFAPRASWISVSLSAKSKLTPRASRDLQPPKQQHLSVPKRIATEGRSDRPARGHGHPRAGDFLKRERKPISAEKGLFPAAKRGLLAPSRAPAAFFGSRFRPGRSWAMLCDSPALPWAPSKHRVKRCQRSASLSAAVADPSGSFPSRPCSTSARRSGASASRSGR